MSVVLSDQWEGINTCTLHVHTCIYYVRIHAYACTCTNVHAYIECKHTVCMIVIDTW